MVNCSNRLQYHLVIPQIQFNQSLILGFRLCYYNAMACHTRTLCGIWHDDNTPYSSDVVILPFHQLHSCAAHLPVRGESHTNKMPRSKVDDYVEHIGTLV